MGPDQGHLINIEQMADPGGARVTKNPQARWRPTPIAHGKERKHASHGQ